MKSKFEFSLKTDEVWFDKPASIKLAVQSAVSSAPEAPSPLGKDSIINIDIVPERDHAKHATCKVFITIPGPPEDLWDVAQTLIRDFVEHLTYFYGPVTLSPLMGGERIPESDEEAKTIGEGTHFMKMTLQEVTGPRLFDGKVLRLFPGFSAARELVQLCNYADNATNPVDNFICLFKIVETEFSRRKGVKTRKVLLSDETFLSLVEKCLRKRDQPPIARDAVLDYVTGLIEARNQCMHLRHKLRFGYSPYDPRIVHEIIPRVEVLRRMAYLIIKGHYERSCPSIANDIPSPNQAL